MNEERCVCCGEIIPEGTQVCQKCDNGSDGKRRRRKFEGHEPFPTYKIKEGHGRFWFRIDGRNSAILFGSCDRKIDKLGINPDAVWDEETTVPVFGIVCQSSEKARALATIFNELANEMEKQDYFRTRIITAE